jgi:hypothetical protein
MLAHNFFVIEIVPQGYPTADVPDCFSDRSERPDIDQKELG